MLISMAYISLLVFERLFLRRKTKITLHKRGELLDRFAALELLDWCEKSILPEELSYEQQDKLLAPLNAIYSGSIPIYFSVSAAKAMV